MRRYKRFSFTTRYVFVVGILLLTVNIMLGIIDFRRSADTIRNLINKDMLDLANTAAALLNGDELGALTAEDVGSEVYNSILRDLSAFQNHADIHFIYAVRQVDEGKFVFTVDADPDDPGEFGEEVVVSEGMVRAGNGIASVDDAPLADRWGNYYSAYCPVFDSFGEVAGIVGVDFDADWYDEQVIENTIHITFTSIISVVGIGIVLLLITNKIRIRFDELNTGLSELSDNVDRLTMKVSTMSGSVHETQPEETYSDELEALNAKIHRMQSNLGLYLEHLQTQAYVDALTNVYNSSAYHDIKGKIEKKIEEGQTQFCVGVFDINSLKEINDQYGHEYGDLIIKGAARVISGVFGDRYTYRIGGDEFVVIMEGMDESAFKAKMMLVDNEIKRYNEKEKTQAFSLALSKGTAVYCPEQDTSFKDVFSRADKSMYADKKAYYLTHPDRRNSER